MKRLVYAPQVNAWVKTDTGIFDLSSYITDFAVHRRVNAVSSAELTFRNPKVSHSDGEQRFMFTQHSITNPDGTTSYGPMFHPMDPVTIVLTRLKGYPVQVFTGYCDQSPYVQLYPGVAKMTASCTLKRLKHTYWDPGLPFVSDYLASLGWKPVSATGGLTFNPTVEQAKSSGVTDSSFGYLTYRILQDVGGWSFNDIYVQELPSEAIQTVVTGIYAELTGDAKANFEDVKNFLTKVIGASPIGGAVSSGDNGGDGGDGEVLEDDIVTKDNFRGTGVNWTHVGKGSYYGDSRKYNIEDPGDDSYGSQRPASGADPDQPGFALYRSLGRKPNYDWFVVRSPSGRAAALPQTDKGPAPGTGRVVDINTAAAIGVFGYKKSNGVVDFPTDQGTWKLFYAGRGDRGRKRAERIVRDG